MTDTIGEARPTPVEPDARCSWSTTRNQQTGRCSKPLGHAGEHLPRYEAARLAVEPDGLPLDVERLWSAMFRTVGAPSRKRVAEIAAEYARLASTPSEAKP